LVELPHIFIATPPFNEGSDGVKMLHFLCHSLNKVGIKSSLILMDPRDPSNNSFISPMADLGLNKELNTPAVKVLNEIDLLRDVIIYPEIIQGNPLKGKNIARYFLNKNGFITGLPVTLCETDFVLSYQKIFEPNAHFNLFYPMQNVDQIPTRDEVKICARSLSLTYIGKGSKYGDCVRIGGTLGLDWKKTKEEYHLLLESSKFVFTWDPITGVVFDAVVRGCVPVLLTLIPWGDKEVYNQEIHIPTMTLLDFDEKLKYYKSYESFLDDRDAMIAGVIELQKNWDTRLVLFLESMLKWFKLV